MEDSTVKLNGVDIHYRTIGNGPVLFLVSPGWGVGSGYLQRAFSALAKHLRLVFIDTRGSGLSGRPADPTRMSSVGLKAFIGQVLPLYLHRPEKSLSLAQDQLSGPISSYAFASQFAADAAFPIDQTKSLSAIRAKVLIMVGRHDYICPVALSERLYENIPESQLVIFEESGHLPWLEEPNAFFAELERFLIS